MYRSKAATELALAHVIRERLEEEAAENPSKDPMAPQYYTKEGRVRDPYRNDYDILSTLIDEYAQGEFVPRKFDWSIEPIQLLSDPKFDDEMPRNEEHDAENEKDCDCRRCIGDESESESSDDNSESDTAPEAAASTKNESAEPQEGGTQVELN
jgi:hypothetical protein